jgi:hypothetical protein
MIVSIMQPAYLPWLGYFHRIATSDLHIVLDHVQLDKNSRTKFTNRNKIRTKDGWCWLTVPLRTKGKFGSLYINQLEIADDSRWAEKHWATIRLNYNKAPYFAEHAAFFEEIYTRHWANLNGLLREITTYMLLVFGIKTALLYSSQMAAHEKKDELILSLCQAVGATTYISGPFGKNYLHGEFFQEARIQIIYHEYCHPRYPQVWSGFEAYMSALDLLFNCGPASLEILTKDQEGTAA